MVIYGRQREDGDLADHLRAGPLDQLEDSKENAKYDV